MKHGFLYTPNGWFIRENPINMDDLVDIFPLFLVDTQMEKCTQM